MNIYPGGATPYNIGMENSLTSSSAELTPDVLEKVISDATKNELYFTGVNSAAAPALSLTMGGGLNGNTNDFQVSSSPMVGWDWGVARDYESRDTYEFKLVDGTRVIQDLRYSDILELKEVELNSPDGHTRKIVHLTLLDNRGRGTKTLEIDCNLSMFMKIIGHKYKSWAKSLMEESVKNGLETN